jgi:NAD(P)H-hydrate epimerase
LIKIYDNNKDMSLILRIENIASMIKPIEENAHKYTRGHGLLIAGSSRMLGCMILSARGGLRSGLGVLSIDTCAQADMLIHSCIPEALLYDKDRHYHAIAIGPGIGRDAEAIKRVEQVLLTSKLPLVIDADALNILGENPSLLDLLPSGSILTPHIGEFDRLFGPINNQAERLVRQKEESHKRNITIILKGPLSSITTGDGHHYQNSTGNAGMATAGSGDVLTGILLALLAQGYSSSHAAQIGTFVHGLSGDMASKDKGQLSLIASDIIDFLPLSWQEVTKYTKFV